MSWENSGAIVVGIALLTVAFVPAVAGIEDPTDRGGGQAEAPGNGLASSVPSVASVPQHAEPVLKLMDQVEQIDTAPTGSSLAASLEAAQMVVEVHAERINLPAPDPIERPAHDAPSSAVTSVVQVLGGELTQEQFEQAERLDQLPSSVADELARVLDAYHAYAIAAQTAFEDSDADLALDQGVHGVDSSLQGYERIGVNPTDVATVLAERNGLMDATVQLQEALEDEPHLSSSQGHDDLHVDVPPYVNIDLTSTSNTYLNDYHFLLDGGGSDTYLNNAGGSMTGDCNLSIHGAALIDLGDGTIGSESDFFNADRASGEWTGDACGKNGGAHGPSAGLLVNAGGDNVYGNVSTSTPTSEFSQGVNGGGYAGGHGLLVDAKGSDTYNGGSHGINGGASTLGATGLLVDGGGPDTMVAENNGTNGGGYSTSHGALTQLGASLTPLSPTDDTLQAGLNGTNGGASLAGSGLALDTSIRDTTYEAGLNGTNGGGHLQGQGALVDLLGEETYDAGSFGTNGGGSQFGAGFLYDADGDDTYMAGFSGVNGGGSLGVGLLVDTGGADSFQGPNSCSDPGFCTEVPKGLLGLRIEV